MHIEITFYKSQICITQKKKTKKTITSKIPVFLCFHTSDCALALAFF